MATGNLQLENVTKEFVTPEKRTIRAVDSVNLDVTQGQFVTLLGPSGCGKTTTLRMVAGFEYPTFGKIILDGKDIAMTAPNKREMAMVFQSYALFPHLTVFENIAYGLRLQNKSSAEIQQTVGEMTKLVNLGGLERRRPSELSGGQQQRVALARAIAIKPRVLLFDEPLSNLDAKLRVGLRTEIRRLQKSLGITSLYVTHDQSEAMSLSDLIVVMNAGKIEQAGSPRDIYQRPASKFVADFIGRANFAPIKVRSTASESVEADVFGKTMRLNAHPKVTTGDATMLVRPESVTLRRDGDGMDARIKTATYYGSEVEYEIDLNGLHWVVNDIDVVEPFREGDAVKLTFVSDRAYVLAN
jgi:iron(III) transport system ATP-binding protein